MKKYIDGFVFPVPKARLSAYQKVAEKVAEIWKAHGAIAYCEFVGDEMTLPGTKSFIDTVEVQEDEVVVFGWVVFPSKEVRNSANESVPKDPRMEALVSPLMNPDKRIFDATRMVYGGFQSLVESSSELT